LSSLPMLRDHLFVGTGIGAYIFLSPIYLKQFPENIAFDRAHKANKVKAKIQAHAASPLAPFKSRRYQKNKRTAQEEKLYQQIIIKEGLETVMGKLTRGVEI
ncbi:MAG: hypothetical protein D3905_05645, partial [Candidatus Electrothrix sp. AS4_5]|nr:hypothetical protein [Candidatus Electrothrix gigas]